MSSGTEKNTGYSPLKDQPIPDELKQEKPFTDNKWIHPEHWKMHSESAELLQEMVDDIQGSISELEKLKEKVTSG